MDTAVFSDSTSEVGQSKTFKPIQGFCWVLNVLCWPKNTGKSRVHGGKHRKTDPAIKARFARWVSNEGLDSGTETLKTGALISI